MMKSLTEFFGEVITTTMPADISEAARERARVSLIHNLAVAMAGRRREQVAFRLAVSCHAAPAQATLLHNGARVSTDAAAFANGALFHARSQDDTHPDSTSHPGAPVMAAALAIAEETGASGGEFLDAIIIGYEVLCRVGRDFDQLISKRGYRAAAVFGVFGATAAAARLLKLDPVQAGHALGLATHMSGGLSQVWHEGSAEFPLQLGFAARSGIEAARAAGAGATAAKYALEGPRGFYNAYAGVAGPAVEAVADYGHWQIEEVTVKPFPACAILQGPMQLLCELLAREGLHGEDVSSLDLHLNPYEAGYTGIDNPGPFSSATATKMSAQFCLGNGLAYGRLALSDLEQLSDPSVLAHASKIRVVPTSEVAERICLLRITTSSGRVVEKSLEEAVGRPSVSQVQAFALGLASEFGVDQAAIGRMLDLVAGISEAPDVGELVACVSQTGIVAA
ncbi:MmgE/PrpD family protein [Aquamicrobium sp. cd-1]|uniref:MmgE/PrpD family protein n=2 Tax=Aquamicrobium zhengzhouense TaxID=2781738 RepID=A0ABS0SGI5_9HYPH|nr:MmgE/PrpD family protein [Aquamicrobium zhengzhouense]